MTSNSEDSSSSRQERLDEILADLMRAVDAGESIDSDDWLSRHPEFEEELREFFAQNERVEKLVRPLRNVASQALHVRCPHCHHPIELLNEAPLSDLSCPSCGSRFNLVSEKTVSHFGPGEKTMGHFELLDRVGVGQFGSVWKARDTKLDRTVALKIPRHAHLDGSQAELFLRDARAAAQLKHPNIVGVHEVGKHDDTIYIVSDFIHGATLKEWLAAKSFTPREVADLCVKIANALHHAHEAGVIHRDLKPGNIMMDADGEPHIVDFGLAKREAGEITMTVEGQILGTPAYMSPEQARGEGHSANRRTDVYSLGVILFELLTGELPFRGDKQMLIVQILNDEPPSPRKLNSSAPRDLETICLKCLEKEAHKRYGTAALLADDLGRYLAGEPVRARRITSFERVRRWAHRCPAVATLIGVTAFFVVLGISGLIVSNRIISSALRQKTVVLGNLNRALTDRERALTEKTEALQRETNALKRLEQAHADLEGQAKELESRQHALYRSMLQLAHAQAMGNDVALADRNLEQIPTELRGWEWRYAKRLCHPDVLTLTGHECVEVSSDGKWLAVFGEEGLEIREAPSGRLVRAIRSSMAAPRRLAIAPDNSRIAIAAHNQVQIVNAKTWEVATRLEATSPIRDIHFSPDGRQLAAGCEQNDVSIWNISDGKLLQVLADHEGPVIGVSYDPRGETLACATTGEVSFWNASAAKKKGVFDDLIDWTAGLAGDDNLGVHDVEFSPSGEIIAIADGDTVRLVNSTTYRETLNLAGHNGGVQHLSFDSKGQTLATASSDGTIRLWDVNSGQSHRTLPWHKKGVVWVSQSRDGRWLASVSADEFKLWDLSPNWDVTRMALHTDAAYSLAFAKDSTLLVSGGGRYKRRAPDAEPREELAGGETRVVTLETGQIAFQSSDEFSTRFGVLAVDIAPDGFRVAAAGAIGTRIWDIGTGNQLVHIADLRAKGEIWSVSFDPSGRYLATSSRNRGTVLWDARSGQLVKTFDTSGYVQFSPDGTLLASSHFGKFKVFRVDDGVQILDKQLTRSTWRFAYSPDGSHIAFSYDTRRADSGQKHEFAEVRDASTGRLILRLESNVKRDYGKQDYISGVYGICYSPDGRRIGTASGDKTVRIWDALTGHELLILDHPNQVFCVEFSPNGKQLATASGHWCGPRVGELRIYQAL